MKADAAVATVVAGSIYDLDDSDMVECKVSIQPEQVRYAFRRRRFVNLLLDHLATAIGVAFGCWVVVAIIDTLHDQGLLISQHGFALLSLAIVTAIWFTVRNHRHQVYSGGDMDLKADEWGMLYSNPATRYLAWSDFCYYREFPQYYLLILRSGRATLLPNTAELAELLQLIRQHVPSYRDHLRTSARAVLANPLGTLALMLPMAIALYFLYRMATL